MPTSDGRAPARCGQSRQALPQHVERGRVSQQRERRGQRGTGKAGPAGARRFKFHAALETLERLIHLALIEKYRAASDFSDEIPGGFDQLSKRDGFLGTESRPFQVAFGQEDARMEQLRGPGSGGVPDTMN